MGSYLILGGCGFIGRHMVVRLANDPLCAKLVICDVTPPSLAFLSENQKECFKSSKVLFKQIDVCNEEAFSKFTSEHPCDYVINLAAETRFDLPTLLYEKNILNLGTIAAKYAALMNAKKFVQVTSAKIKILDSEKVKKGSRMEMLWNQKKLEDHLKSVQGLNYSVVRPALVYGPGDKNGLTPMIIMMSIYKKLGETLQMLWNEKIHVNTVHVDDVVSACLHALKIEGRGNIFELADNSNSTQGSIADIISKIFNVKYEFLGKLKQKFVELTYEDVVSDINEKHLVVWLELCSAEQISVTPLHPCITQENLKIDDFEADSSAITATGFLLEHPKLLDTEIKKIIDEYLLQKYLPRALAP